ncbi:MAG: hypothetical protein ACM3Y9_02545 [Ignavibacteria bacterium]
MAAMWSFDVAGGWRKIEDFLDSPGIEEAEERRKHAGFSSYARLSVGDRRLASCCVDVFNRDERCAEPKGAEYAFLVVIEIGHVEHCVAVRELPDLLELLRQTLPLSTSVDHWAMMRSRYDSEREKEQASVEALSLSI